MVSGPWPGGRLAHRSPRNTFRSFAKPSVLFLSEFFGSTYGAAMTGAIGLPSCFLAYKPPPLRTPASTTIPNKPWPQCTLRVTPALDASLWSSQGVRRTCHKAMAHTAITIDRPALLRLVHPTAFTRWISRYVPVAVSAAAASSPLQVRLH